MINEKHEDILNKYSETWDRIKELTGKHFDFEVIHKNNMK